MEKAKPVAALVNGNPIYEQDVTEYIEGFRQKNPQYETDMEWAEFLRSNGYTPESVRTYVLNTIFIPRELILQKSNELGIHITDTDLDKVIEREKEYYENRYGENSWESVLASFGYTVDSWRQNEYDRLLEEELERTVITDVKPTEAEIQITANENASTYNGKSSYYILFDTEEKANEERGKLTQPVTEEAFSKLGTPVFAGWNSLPSPRDVMDKEYIQALNGLNAGEVSAAVKVGDKYALVFCNAVFNVGVGGESVALKDVPEDIYDQLVSDATKQKASQLFDEWLEDLKETSEIEISPMPEGLPYSVNVAITE